MLGKFFLNGEYFCGDYFAFLIQRGWWIFTGTPVSIQRVINMYFTACKIAAGRTAQ